MKIIYFILVLSMVSCGSAQFHIQRAEKHTQKAIEKGAVITSETDTIKSVHTVTELDTFVVNDTVYINTIKTVNNTILEKGEIRYITRKDKRKELRNERIQQKNDHKINKERIRQEGRTQRVKYRTERSKQKKNRVLSVILTQLYIFVVSFIIIYLWTRRKK